MTRNEAAVLTAVHELFDGHLSPSITDLAEQTGLARSGVHRALCALRRMGHVTWEPGRPRTLAATDALFAPSHLEAMSDEALRFGAAVIAGILAQRGGAHQTAEVFHRIADRLPGVRGRAA